MSFPQDVANKALVACNRCCCICHKFCGTKIELHHIKQKAYGGNDTFDNCIPLCLDCHADMGRGDSKHPKGKRYTEEELRGHRDNWYAKVRRSISTSDQSIYADDIKLFHTICDIFTDEIQNWLRDTDMNNIQPYGLFEPLAHLLYDSKNPSFEFLNVDLESQKSLLLSKTRDFVHFNSAHTFPLGPDMPDVYAPQIWLYNHGYIRFDYDSLPKDSSTNINVMVKEYESTATKLNELATSVWKQYVDFVRTGRRILSVRVN